MTLNFNVIESGTPTHVGARAAACWYPDINKAILLVDKVGHTFYRTAWSRESAGPWTVQQLTIGTDKGDNKIIYDSDAKILRYIGLNGSSYSQLWTFDGTTWTNLGTIGIHYTINSNGAFVYFPGYAPMLMASNYIDHVYIQVFSGTSVSSVNPTGGPSDRNYFPVEYDPGLGGLLMFGGLGGLYYSGIIYDETYFFDGSVFTQLNPATVPPARYHHHMRYDPGYGGIIMWGGKREPYGSDNWCDDVWGFKNWNWHLLRAGTYYASPSIPTNNAEQALCTTYMTSFYDPGQGGIVLYGGSENFGGTYDIDQTWLYWSISPPTVIKVEVEDLKTLLVTFEREMTDNSDLVNPDAYLLSGGSRVSAVVRIGPNQVRLYLERELRNRRDYQLTMNPTP